jgi:uncharacterized phage protein (TIGR01671 family)
MNIHLQYDGHPHQINSRSFGECLDRGEFSDDLEIMQWTGLKDKNGKEAFDGDIVRVYIGANTHMHKQIKYVGHSFCMTDKEEAEDGSLRGTWYFDFEIIGNIHESPELLK